MARISISSSVIVLLLCVLCLEGGEECVGVFGDDCHGKAPLLRLIVIVLNTLYKANPVPKKKNTPKCLNFGAYK